MTTHTQPTPAQRLLGKVSLITGAAQGIGLATAMKFAKEGAIVILCDVKQTAVDQAVKQCQAIGAEACGFVVDVTQREMVDATVKAVLDKFDEYELTAKWDGEQVAITVRAYVDGEGWQSLEQNIKLK